MGDLQYSDHVAVSNLNNMYWKTTKNFADGCASHISGGRFEDGNLALPDQAAFIIERTSFAGSISLEANHHCNVGVTGVLCMPTVVLDRVEWAVTSQKWLYFNGDDSMSGGIFTLAPPEALSGNSHGHIFPPTFVSLCSSSFEYLLNITYGSCVLAESLGVGQRYDYGILCRTELRALRVYTRDLTINTAQRLLVQVHHRPSPKSSARLVSEMLIPFHRVAETKKQGYSLPVVPGLELGLEYSLSLEDGSTIPAWWIIEFSDPVFGNRWGTEHIRLRLHGRDCGAGIGQPSVVSSQHDRRYIWAGVADDDHLIEKSWGRGACTHHPPMPAVECAAVQPPELPGCAECQDTHCSACNEARCGTHGKCTALDLGGDLAVSRHACTCESAEWRGPTCEANPCLSAGPSPCGNNGKCVSADEFRDLWHCECEPGYSGARCEVSCDGICSGSFPYGCNAMVEAAVHLCEPGGGCQYLQNDDNLPDGWCVFKSTSAAIDECDEHCTVDDDCHHSTCVRGQCSAPAPIPDGTICHSSPWGVCMGGVCIPGTPPPSATTDNTSCVVAMNPYAAYQRPGESGILNRVDGLTAVHYIIAFTTALGLSLAVLGANKIYIVLQRQGGLPVEVAMDGGEADKQAPQRFSQPIGAPFRRAVARLFCGPGDATAIMHSVDNTNIGGASSTPAQSPESIVSARQPARSSLTPGPPRRVVHANDSTPGMQKMVSGHV